MTDIQQNNTPGPVLVSQENPKPGLPAAAAKAKTFDVCLPSGERREFSAPTDLRTAILAGEIPRESTIGGSALPNAKAALTVEAWAKANDAMRSVYTPVWAHAMKGALYGGLIVAALKLLDTFIEIAQVNASAALMFLIVMAAMFSPKYKLQIAFLGFLVWQQSNLRFGAISTFLGIPFGAALFAAFFGASGGMAVGTIVGYLRTSRAKMAPDALPEGSKPLIWGLAAPAVVFATGVALYIYALIPWMANMAKS